MRNMQRKGQQNVLRYARLKKMQYEMSLPKLKPKKTPSRVVQCNEARRSRRNAKEVLHVNGSDLNGYAH